MNKLDKLKQYAAEHHIPIITPDVEKLLCNLLVKHKPQKILEIGTAIGYSALIMSNCIDCHIDTIERNEERANMARENLKGKNVNIITANCKAWIKENRDKKYDFIFQDGPIGQYLSMYDTLKETLNPGGILFCDNVLYNGLVLGDEFVIHKRRAMVVNLRKFLDRIQNDSSVTTEILEIGDGIAIITKNN